MADNEKGGWCACCDSYTFNGELCTDCADHTEALRQENDRLNKELARLSTQLTEARGALDEIAYFDPDTEHGPASPFAQHAFAHVQGIALAALEVIKE